jgi:hypothetical protein
MKIAKLHIENILGIEELETKLGNLTVIEGQNATGKTSIIEAIKGALGGGEDATLLRRGAEVGEVVLLMDNGETDRMRVTADRTTRKWIGADGVEKKKPQTIIDGLLNKLSFNPVSFLTAPREKRVQWLLEVLPITADPKEIEASAGVPVLPQDIRPNALDTIECVRKRMYDQRTGTNRLADEKKKTVSTLESSLPPSGADAVGALQAVKAELACSQEEYQKLSEELKTLLQSRLDEIREKTHLRIQAIKDEQMAAEQVARQDEEATRATLEQEWDPTIDASREEIAKLEAAVVQAERARTTTEMISRFKDEQGKAEAESLSLTEGLGRLETLKGDLLKTLPIKGYEVRDGQDYKDGIPFERVNKAKQVAVAFQVAKLLAKDLGLVCVDNLECLDADTFAAFEKAALSNKELQFVVTRVTEGPLTIETQGGE